MKDYIKIKIFTMIIAIGFLFIGCAGVQPKFSAHSPAQDSYWIHPYTGDMWICPEGMFDEENRGRTWWTFEDLEKLQKELEGHRRKQGT